MNRASRLTTLFAGLSAALLHLLPAQELKACSMLYWIDPVSGKIYVVNNEDYWYDVDACVRIEPEGKGELARLWYGWDRFAQGGVNEAGLFFDGAVTPSQEAPEGSHGPEGNMGDRLLASCRNVEEALEFLENARIGLRNAHMMIGDRSGQAVVVEWREKERYIVPIEGNRLVMTNFLLSAPEAGNFPCARYASIQERLDALEAGGEAADLLTVGQTIGGAVQSPREGEDGRTGGTLYTSFINLSESEFVLVYQLDNERVLKLDLKECWAEGKRQRIKLNKL